MGANVVVSRRTRGRVATRPKPTQHTASAGAPLDQLAKRIASRTAHIGILGLGYVGLPLAVEFAKAGFHVTGIDPDAERVEGVNSGRSYILDISSEELRRLRANRLSATASFDALAEQDAIIICVPTPLRKTREPDMSYIVSATNQIATRVHRGQLIVLESTTYPGTTEEVILPVLEAGELKVGRDFCLAFSPERIDPGNSRYTTRTIPKVIGGITPRCTELATMLYRCAVDQTVPVSGAKAAEMVKLLENTFRAVNIGLVNEIALICNRLGIDVWEVIDAAKTKPFGFMPFYPGPGIGGHCLDGNEVLVVKRGDQIDVLTFEELARQLTAERRHRIIHRQGATFIRPQSVDVLSFDLERRHVSFQPLTWLVARPYQERMVHLRTGDGRQLTVTDLHPMIIQNGSLNVKWARDLTPDDELVVIHMTPEWLDGDKRQRLLTYFDRRVKRMPTKTFRSHSGYATVRVGELSSLNGTRTVYSAEVDQTHTFVTSYGIVVHNCIPSDPMYLAWKVRVHGFEARFIELATQINSAMPEYVVEKIGSILNDRRKSLRGSRILLLGLAYKKDVSDLRDSPAFDVARLLDERGAQVDYHDPHVPSTLLNGTRRASLPLTAQALQRSDCVVLLTNHSGLDYPFILRHAPVIFDTRNQYRGRSRSSRVVKL